MRHRKLGLMIGVAVVAAAAMLSQTVGARPTAGPIVIGLVTNSSGFMSAYDGPPDNGVRLAVQAINAKGGVLGRQLKVEHFDEKS
jgi:ABC-type branched-subunit amino acid transport system substrate-binding protein